MNDPRAQTRSGTRRVTSAGRLAARPRAPGESSTAELATAAPDPRASRPAAWQGSEDHTP